MHSTNGIRKTAFSSVIPLAGWLLAGLLGGAGVRAAQVDLVPPPGSVAFGTRVTALTNGNFVVTDPQWTDGVNTNLGAVYLYHGATLTNIMRITGSHANDQVGSGGIQVITNGNFLILSRYWANGSATNAGAVTWCSASNGPRGNVGFSNVVSSANSLVGAYANDSVGYEQTINILSNGNYVVISPSWNNTYGAATWGSGSTGVVGVVSSSNSRVGATAGDFLIGQIKALPNGNYCIYLPYFDVNGGVVDQGASSWGSGTGPSTGGISAANSLMISGRFALLTNGNYVVGGYSYSSGQGAATWVNGSTGLPVGNPDPGNSLMGSSYTGVGITALANGHYVVSSFYNANDDGAVTWCNKDGSTVGYVSTGNSVYGSGNVGGEWANAQVTALANGNYVVTSGYGWYPGSGVGTGRVGMTVLLSGSGPSTGYFYTQNHIRGGILGDFYATQVFPLPNGSFLLFNSNYKYYPGTDITVIAIGAITWCNGNVVGGFPNSFISYQTSWIGSSYTIGGVTRGEFVDYPASLITILPNGNYLIKVAADASYGGFMFVGQADGVAGYSSRNITTLMMNGNQSGDMSGSSAYALPNGNYVITAPNYTIGGVVNAGAVRWCSGTVRTSGTFTSANSLVGSTAGDQVGNGGTRVLPNGDYVVSSPNWHNGAVTNAGAVTWCNSTTGTNGYVSATNSIVGSSTGDGVGTILPTPANVRGTNAIIVSVPTWNNGSVSQAGAVTVATNRASAFGVISVTNSLVGTHLNDHVGSGYNLYYTSVADLGNGYATAWSKDWDNGAVADAGAVSLLNLTNLAGSVSASNSVLGMASGGGLSMNYSYDYVNSQLVVGQGPSSRVTLLGRASAPVTITNQPAPASQEVVMGGSVTFTVGGAGTGPFLYQWCVGRNTIVGATNASLTLTNLQVANSGGYWVRVSGPSGGAISDVASLRVLSPPSLAGGLTGFWKCEDGSDSSGYNHPLTPHSRYPTALDDQSYTFTDVYPSIGKWLSRSCANTYYYDEYANWATITNYPKTTNAMTIAFWLMTWNFISPAVIACDGDAVANSSFSIQTWWNSPASRYDLKFQYADGSCSFPTSTSAGGYWRHLAMTMDGATARVYTNGVLAANFAYSGPITNGSTALYFNGTGTNVTKSGSQVYYYSGGYDEIMMWDRALSTNEMQVVYGQGMMGNSAILIAAPAITAQPQDVNVNPGQTATFTVGVSGAPLAYQWLKNGTNLPGATANPLVLTNIVISDNGVYALRVTNYLGSVTSSNATLLAGNPPTFAAQPGSVLTLVGPARLLSATVAGDSPMSYQWRLNGADVAGAVANSLAFTGIQLSHAGNYTLVATNLAGTATSSVAVVEVVLPLTNIMILAGLSTNLTLTCAGGAALTYQWSASSGPLTGVTTGSSLSLTNLKVAQSGNYRAVVTSAFGVLTNTATVTIMLAPTIASQPASVFTNLGATVGLRVIAVSGGVPTYQWYCKEQPLSGATNGTLTLAKTELAQMGYYRVRITNPVGYVDSKLVWVVLGPLENSPLGWGDGSVAQTLFSADWTNLVSLSAGNGHTLGLRGDGTVLAVGANDAGQVSIPAGLGGVVGVAAGSWHSLALRENGTVAAWGANDNSQTNVPAGLSNVVAVAAGATHSAALKADGSVTVWGGDDAAERAVPAMATNGVKIGAAAQYTVVLRRDGQAVVWGANLNGLDTLPAGATNLVSVAAGAAHILAARADGAVLVWGDNTFNQTTLPAAVTNVSAVAAGAYHSLAILPDNSVAAWGAGANNEADQWPHYAQSTVPAGVSKATAIAAGQSFSVGAVPAAPYFITPLASRVGYVLGQTVVLPASAGGCLPLRYQWFKDGTVVAGATNATLALINLGPYAGATYLVTVSNLIGVVTSGNLSLERDTPYEPLQITVQPQSVNTLRAGSVVLSLGAQGTGPIRFQWRKDGSPLAGATNEFYRAATAQLTDSAGYSVVVNNDWETLTSDTAQVNVLDPPTWPESYTNRTLSAGQALTLTADNTGSGPFDYQWYHNGQPIEGVNSNQLVLASLTWQDEGEYAVKITNPVGTITRTFYNLHVVSPPYLLTDVADVASPRGTNAEFFVRAGGEPPLTYLWYQTGAVMPDEFHTNLVVLNVAYAHTNLTWHVVVSNFMGTSTSREARLTIIEPPTIVTQPVSLLAEPNTEVRFSVVCGGTRPLLYQWYLNGAAVAGGTSTALVIASVTAGKQGIYEVEVSNPAGRVVSQAATLAANVAPLALGVSTGRTNVAPGSSFELTARVAGAGPFAFQWQLNGVDLAGQTNLSLVITNTAPEAAGWYTFTVSNVFGGATLASAAGTEVRVVNLPYIESGPDDVLALLGRPATFSVVVRGTNRLSYQWMKEGQAISGATGAHYSIADPKAPDAGQYSVAVANAEGTTWSSVASLTFAKLPKIIRQPANGVAAPGSVTSFTVGVESQFAVSYQWRQDGSDLPGQTNAALEVTLPLRVVGWDHSYSVVVGSDVGRVSSLSAVLTLQRTPAVMLKHSRLVTQTLRLHPGWNSIFLTVQPVSNKVAEVLGDAPWTSVWMWRDRENSVQFIQEMTEAAWNGPDWLVNFQTNRTESFQNNLFRLFVNQAYLVHLDSTNEVDVEVQGEPALDVKQWRPDSYNLTGLPLEAGRDPKAGDYFRPSLAHYDSTTGQIKPIYRLDADGHWQLLTNDDLLTAGVAYWFYVRGGSAYLGPVEVSLSYGRGLLFTKDVETLRLTLLNRTDAARRLWFSAHPLYAGGFPLMVREVSDQGAGFVEMPVAYAVDVPANGRTEFILGADRLRTAVAGFESVMIVSDDNGLGLQLPVLVEHLGAVTESGGQIKPSVTGLWVGQATFDGISEVNSVTALTNRIRFTNDLGQITNIVMLSYTNIPSAAPTPVPAGLSQRIIFHVDTNNVTRLLSEVFQLYRESVQTNDADGYKITARQGQNVLVTQRSRMGDFKGSRMRDGAMVGRRISSPSFAFEGAAGTNNYVACAGQFGPGQTLTATFGLSANHPLNPFKHKYHPDHDNLGADFKTYQEEAYGVIREVTLVFDAQSGGVSPSAGYEELNGTYQEKIRGLHRNPIYGSGRFVLRRFSPIGELNPAN